MITNNPSILCEQNEKTCYVPPTNIPIILNKTHFIQCNPEISLSNQYANNSNIKETLTLKYNNSLTLINDEINEIMFKCMSMIPESATIELSDKLNDISRNNKLKSGGTNQIVGATDESSTGTNYGLIIGIVVGFIVLAVVSWITYGYFKNRALEEPARNLQNRKSKTTINKI